MTDIFMTNIFKSQLIFKSFFYLFLRTWLLFKVSFIEYHASRVRYFIVHGVPYLFRAAGKINKWSSAYPFPRLGEIMRNNGALGGCPAGPTRRRGPLKN